MIPARLALRNFLSYGDDCPPLELEGIGLACLCGDNGHGKSTLIDAITWALWGRARGRELDALIHHGRREMEVDFEFLAGEARYRVVRRRQRVGARGAGRPGLEFQVRHGEEWKPLTEPSVALTEAAIERTLRLSYETFINSALLLQGKADLFTAAGPANRKRVLAEILDLGRYGLYEERAREERRARQQEIVRLEGAVAQLAPLVARLPALEEERVAEQARLSDVARVHEEQTSILAALRMAQDALERQRDELRAAQADLARERGTLARLEEDQTALENDVAVDEPIAATERAVRAGYERLQAARTAQQEWLARLERLQAIEHRIQPLQQSIARAEAELRERLAVLRGRRDDARRETSGLPRLEKRLAELETLAGAFAAREAAIAAVETEERALLDEIARLTAEAERFRRASTGGSAGMAGLPRPDTGEPVVCPLCRSMLDADALARVHAAHRAEIEDATRALRGVEAELDDTKRRAEGLGRMAGEQREALSRDRDESSARVSETRLLLEQARQAAARLSDVTVEMGQVADRLAAGRFAEEARAALNRLLAERDALDYSARRHKEASRRVNAALPYEERHQRLVQALARLEANRPALARERAAVEGARARVADLIQRVRALNEVINDQPEYEERIRDLDARVAALAAERIALDQQVGRLDGQIAEYRSLEATERANRARLAALRSEEQIYADLATAFGRKGVQAFIIDAVLPEVEEEANRLLGMMTGGRMRVRLDTQRETRAGDLAETLELAITDEWGTRDYEMYSGGEAFRINLALRVALSKLLARRSGAPLPTLIIDEGFGALDASGRELIVDAVAAIREEFRCLLVVTHIDELKQLFDTRIEVVKRERGSVARVVRV